MTSRYRKELLAEETLRLIANGFSDEMHAKASYSFEDLVQSCFFNNIPCSKYFFLLLKQNIF